MIDLQGLSKSALVAWLARLKWDGKRYAMANRTDGSGYEAPTRWLADVALPMTPRSHAVQRSRDLCAQVFGYAAKGFEAARYGLQPSETHKPSATGGSTVASMDKGAVALVHGTSRADKCWPESHWLTLGKQLLQAGHTLVLPHGNAEELARSERLAKTLGQCATVWPRADLGALTDQLAACVGVIGVDSGLSHIAVALDLPHVQLYNFDTAWRTGPQGHAADGAGGITARQCSIFAQPAPSVDAVWHAWQQVSSEPATGVAP